MYLKHFKLKEYPFLSSPDDRYLYLSDQVNETLQKCLYMITNHIGPVYTAGPIGTGKTTLSNRLVQQIKQAEGKYLVAYLIIPPDLTLNALLRLVMDEFNVKTVRSYAGCLKAFADWLVTQHHQRVKPVVILDEAQNLTGPQLQLLHFLLNYETSREKLLQIMLFGQSELADKIEKFPELKSRMYPAGLSAFNRPDMAKMIEFRWYIAGGEQPLPFSEQILDEIFRVSLGLPREIVKLCDLTLLAAYSHARTHAELPDIQKAAEELRLSAHPA